MSVNMSSFEDTLAIPGCNKIPKLFDLSSGDGAGVLSIPGHPTYLDGRQGLAVYAAGVVSGFF